MQSSCSYVFLCTAILCWNNNKQNTFFNLTDCSPKTIYFRSNIQLIPLKSYFKIEKYGFTCSNCTKKNSLRKISNRLTHCDQQSTKIKLINTCRSLFQSQFNREISCQCFPSNNSLHNWIKSLTKPEKSFQNVNRSIRINESASLAVFILISLVILLMIIGGFISVIIFYFIKFQSNQRQILK